MLDLKDLLENEQKLLHELQLRDRIKSSEYHYAMGFNFDGFFEDYLVDEIFGKISLLSKEIEFDSFKLGCSWPITVEGAEKSHLKFSVQTRLLQRMENELNKKPFFGRADVEFLVDFNKKLVLFRMNSVFVRGMYCKYSREIAQTEFFCNKCRGKGCWYCNSTGHFSKDSVEQLIGKVMVPAFDAKLIIFHGAGREDMDVLMLGKGRPFIAELVLPRKRVTDLARVESEINSMFKGKIFVSGLSMCQLCDVSELKDAHHGKVYSALVGTDNEFDVNKVPLDEELSIIQTTPTRVARRRANMDRDKKVTILRVVKITPREYVVDLLTSHGTYVKEFISGDNKRTKPSLSSITGVNCTCVLLDVLEICTD